MTSLYVEIPHGFESVVRIERWAFSLFFLFWLFSLVGWLVFYFVLVFLFVWWGFFGMVFFLLLL